MKRNLMLAGLVMMLASSIHGQAPNRHWSEWTEQEAISVVNNSQWGKTVRGASLIRTMTPPILPNMNQIWEQDKLLGIYRAVPATDFHYRLLSARPVRNAMARIIFGRRPGAGDDLKSGLQAFIDQDFRDWVVITIDFEVREGFNAHLVKQIFTEAKFEGLKKYVFLSIDGKKRVPIARYIPPGEDGLGAKFIFPRFDNGVEIVTAGTRDIRFQAVMNDLVQFDVKFKVPDLIVNGTVEY